MKSKSRGLPFRRVADKSGSRPEKSGGRECLWPRTPGLRSRAAAVRASRGPAAGKRDICASTARQKRHFQQPPIQKPVQPMQMRPATASSPKSRLPESFLQHAFNKMV